MGQHRASFRTPSRHRASRLVSEETTLPSSGTCYAIGAVVLVLVVASGLFGAVRVVPAAEPAVAAVAPVATTTTPVTGTPDPPIVARPSEPSVEPVVEPPVLRPLPAQPVWRPRRTVSAPRPKAVPTTLARIPTRVYPLVGSVENLAGPGKAKHKHSKSKDVVSGLLDGDGR